MADKWEYKAWFVRDDIDKVNEIMARWADAGWELVNGTATSYVEGVNRVHVQYTQYWRRVISG
jgi:hypothetical protein